MMPSSGIIKMSQARDEAMLGNPVNLGAANIRQMAQKSSGIIKMSDLYNTAYGSVITVKKHQDRYSNYNGYGKGDIGSIKGDRVINQPNLIVNTFTVAQRIANTSVAIEKASGDRFNLGSIKSVTVKRIDNGKSVTFGNSGNSYSNQGNIVYFGTAVSYTGMITDSDLDKDVIFQFSVGL